MNDPSPAGCHISAVRSSRDPARVSAAVCGSPVWFESADAGMYATPEAFATTFFIPALHHRIRLRVEEPLDPRWLANTRELLPIYASWWSYPEDYPLVTSSRARPPAETSPRTQGVLGQCFTGGIDSFYSLLRGTHEAESLIFAHGYDIALDDAKRFRHFDKSLRSVAHELALEAIVVRTNVREHPVFCSVSWERTHGAALAAVGLVLSDHLGGLVIPSSYIHENEIPWGSHWDTDPLWSIPGRLEIIHDDASVHRRDKIIELTREPLVQQHLRVCWRNLSSAGNCSRCEKCLRTMVTIETTGRLDAFHRVFDTRTRLPDLLDELPAIPPHLLFIWDDLAGRDVSRGTRQAIKRLRRRSVWRAAGKKARAAGYRLLKMVR